MEKNNHYLKESAESVARTMRGDGTKPIYKREVSFYLLYTRNFHIFHSHKNMTHILEY